MSSGQFYWARNVVKGFGKMWFPLALQEVGDEDQSLLGSVVQELKSGFLGLGSHYPAPYHMTTPGLLLKTLRDRRQELGLPDQIVIETKLSAPAQTMTVAKKAAVKADVGPFPSLPVAANLDIDYSRMSSVTVTFGDETRVRYITTGYLCRLYALVDGDSAEINPAVAIAIDENYIVDQVLLVRNFSVQFTSESEFSAGFGAKLEHVNDAAGGQVSISKTSERTITAKIQDGKIYLAGFTVIDWDSLG